MIALIQRVSHASVSVDAERIAAIGAGLLALIGVERGDGEAQVQRLLERVVTYRVFADAAGRMNLDLQSTGGELLLVPQFTLAADTARGTRPGFSRAAAPERGRALFEQFVAAAGRRIDSVASGRFCADMQVALTNDGPVTFWLRSAPPEPA